MHLASHIGSGPMGDAAMLYRIIEAHSGRIMEVSALWEVFFHNLSGSENVETPSSTVVCPLRLRFGHALLYLQNFGLFVPCGGGSQKGSQTVEGWRLRKRLWGRAWLRTVKKDYDPAAGIADAVDGTMDLAEACDEAPPAALPINSVGMVKPPSVFERAKLFKRLRPMGLRQGSNQEPAGKRRAVSKKCRLKVFMG